jgi:UDP-glucuronate decarboxylase
MNLDDGRVVSNFIVQALRNKPITIYGDGSQTRSFCYVSDLISAFIEMMKTKDSVTGPINLGNPNENSMLQLAETIIKLTNSNSKITFEDLPQDDPKVRQPDITKAKEMLGWAPEINLEDGLKLTIEDFSSRV